MFLSYLSKDTPIILFLDIEPSLIECLILSVSLGIHHALVQIEESLPCGVSKVTGLWVLSHSQTWGLLNHIVQMHNLLQTFLIYVSYTPQNILQWLSLRLCLSLYSDWDLITCNLCSPTILLSSIISSVQLLFKFLKLKRTINETDSYQ